MSYLIQIFGSVGPWVAMVIGVAVLGAVVVAFRQGRAIAFWPLFIGERLGVAPETTEVGDSWAGRPGRAAAIPVMFREYSVDQAADFYQEIAPNYDLRNSGNLVATHLATVAMLQTIRTHMPTLRVLDLGGGTGKLIAVHFFNDDTVSWTYVDSCPAMAAEFRRNLAGYALSANSEILVEDINNALWQLPPASYDVVVLSLVLSSMPTLPNFGLIRQLIAPGGYLVVTDINPSYTRSNPLYKVWVDGAVVALRTTPVDPFDVIHRATAAGLRVAEQKTIGDDSTYYSFLAVFAPQKTRMLHSGQSMVGTPT